MGRFLSYVAVATLAIVLYENGVGEWLLSFIPGAR